MFFSRAASAAAILLGLAAGPLQAGSLWRYGVTDERGMCADKRARGVGDIVTIVVSETAALNNTLNLKTNKTSAAGVEGLASNVLNQFITGIPNALINRKNQTAATTGSNNIVIPSLPTLPVSGANTYTGGGSIQNSQTVTAKVAVQIIDVLPNGNFVIEGLRDVSFSKERQFASLHGTIRPYDIQPDNTVASGNVANAHVEIVSEGTLTDAQKKGWLLKFNDKINPF
ncbi:MAG: flagellar basal body L-ring protein FlgH [Chthoniobacteraceae bacterium]|nr:flagellar basal body L-ring protein FlgH [Chthoniobacteraceae bacterium]